MRFSRAPIELKSRPMVGAISKQIQPSSPVRTGGVLLDTSIALGRQASVLYLKSLML